MAIAQERDAQQSLCSDKSTANNGDVHTENNSLNSSGGIAHGKEQKQKNKKKRPLSSNKCTSISTIALAQTPKTLKRNQGT